MVAALLLLLGAGTTQLAYAAGAARADASPAEPVEPAPVAPEPPPDADRALAAPLVVVGVGGLSWAELTPDRTPTLWSLLEDGAAAAAVTVHTSGQPACPLGGWLSLSAGRASTSARFGGLCLALPPVAAQVSDGVGPAAVAGWAALAAEQALTTYRPQIGTLGSALAAGEVCATAVGPGAALALADRDGEVGRYLPAVSAAAFDCPVTLVDVGTTSVLESLTGGALPVDGRVAAVLDLVPDDATVLVTSVATTVGQRLAMGVALAYGPDVPDELMSTASTRRPGVLRLLDLPSTVVDVVGVDEPAEFQGSPLTLGGARAAATATARSLAEISVADSGLRNVATPLLNTLGLTSIGLALAALLMAALRRGALLRRVVEMALLVLACTPIAAYLVTGLRWWRFEEPVTALWLGTAGIAAVLAAGLYVLPRRPAWVAVLALSAVSTAVLVADAFTGTMLHWGSPFGTSPVVGNRYYGFGNSTYAVFALHTIVFAGVVGGRYLAAGRRGAAVLAVLGVAALAVAVDIWPTWGADVGGGLALAPAFGVLALAVGGRRLTPARGALVLAVGVALVVLVGWLDWLRPAAERSHAGRFMQQVLDGDAADLLARKVHNALASLERGLSAWLTLVGLLIAATVVLLPERRLPRRWVAATEGWPALRATLAALLISAVLGSLVNDWGIRVATVLLTAALPLAAFAGLRALDQRPRPARTVPRSTASVTNPKTLSASTPDATPPARAVVKSALRNRAPTR